MTRGYDEKCLDRMLILYERRGHYAVTIEVPTSKHDPFDVVERVRRRMYPDVEITVEPVVAPVVPHHGRARKGKRKPK